MATYNIIHRLVTGWWQLEKLSTGLWQVNGYLKNYPQACDRSMATWKIIHRLVTGQWLLEKLSTGLWQVNGYLKNYPQACDRSMATWKIIHRLVTGQWLLEKLSTGLWQVNGYLKNYPQACDSCLVFNTGLWCTVTGLSCSIHTGLQQECVSIQASSRPNAAKFSLMTSLLCTYQSFAPPTPMRGMWGNMRGFDQP